MVRASVSQKRITNSRTTSPAKRNNKTGTRNSSRIDLKTYSAIVLRSIEEAEKASNIGEIIEKIERTKGQ